MEGKGGTVAVSREYSLVRESLSKGNKLRERREEPEGRWVVELLVDEVKETV